MPHLCLAQQLAFNSPLAGPAPVSSIVAPSIPGYVSIPSWQTRFDRWVNLKDADFSLRYRTVSDTNGAHEFNQAQQRGIIDGKFKFDAKGRYGISFHASSGRTFNWAYADFVGGGNKQALNLELAKDSPPQAFVLGVVAGLNPADYAASLKSGGWAFYVRRLSLDLSPIEGVAVQYGSFDINRGVSTEMTSYDNDGYIAGERLSIKRPGNIFADEISVTYAYIGDLYTPNFFERADRLEKNNYHQFLVRKKFLKRADASFDYTYQDTHSTYRAATLVDTHEIRVLDSIRVEAYRRPNTSSLSSPGGGKGYGVTVSRKISRVSLDGGIANIDTFYVTLTPVAYAGVLGLAMNGDSYGLGKRYFVRPTIRLAPYLEATGFYTHIYSGTLPPGSIPIFWNNQALNAGLNFDIKKALFPRNRVH